MKTKFVPLILILTVLIIGTLIFYRNILFPSTLVTSVTPVVGEVIEINGINYAFTPNQITVKQGDVVKIKLISQDSPHTFVLNEFGINKFFTYGKDQEISFIADKKGTFEFFCDVPDHRENGMVGTLIVE